MMGKSRLTHGSRTLVAKTCGTCGELKGAVAYRLVKLDGRVYPNTECKTCESRHSNKRTARANVASLTQATRHFAQWTETEIKELERLFSSGMATRDVAKALGRTLRATYRAKNKYLAHP